MMNKIVIAAINVFVLAGSIQAEVDYSYVTDSPSYSIAGGTAEVTVFLKETLINSSTSVIADQPGLGGAGFRVQLSSGSGVVIDSVTPYVSNFAGPVTESGFPGLDVSVFMGIEVNQDGAMPDGGGLIQLGTLTFALSGPGSQATFALSRIDSIGGFTVTVSTGEFEFGLDLDFDHTSPTFTGATGTTLFTVFVPEPTTLGLVAIGGVLLLRKHRHR